MRASENETVEEIVSEKRDNPFFRKCETKKMKPRKKREPKTTHDTWWKGC